MPVFAYRAKGQDRAGTIVRNGAAQIARRRPVKEAVFDHGRGIRIVHRAAAAGRWRWCSRNGSGSRAPASGVIVHGAPKLAGITLEQAISDQRGGLPVVNGAAGNQGLVGAENALEMTVTIVGCKRTSRHIA